MKISQDQLETLKGVYKLISTAQYYSELLQFIQLLQILYYFSSTIKMTSIVELSSNMYAAMKEALLQITNHPQQLETWIKQGGTSIRMLNAALKKGDLNVGSKRHVEASIGKIKGKQVIINKIIDK